MFTMQTKSAIKPNCNFSSRRKYVSLNDANDATHRGTNSVVETARSSNYVFTKKTVRTITNSKADFDLSRNQRSCIYQWMSTKQQRTRRKQQSFPRTWARYIKAERTCMEQNGNWWHWGNKVSDEATSNSHKMMTLQLHCYLSYTNLDCWLQKFLCKVLRNCIKLRKQQLEQTKRVLCKMQHCLADLYYFLHWYVKYLLRCGNFCLRNIARKKLTSIIALVVI